MFRIGHGYDFHRYSAECELYIGGVKIAHDVGLAGHSDADVLIHAICDACLGALAKGDIGQHFPDNEARYHNISSRHLLKEVTQMIGNDGYSIVHLDSTIIADKPKLSPYITEMRKTLAADLGVSIDAISVKATTKEGCATEGMAAHAVVLLEKRA